MSGKPIDALMATVAWQAQPAAAENGSSALPYVTHSGVLHIAGQELRCYRLNDGRAIIDADDFNAFFESALGVWA